jgi:putative membrane protein
MQMRSIIVGVALAIAPGIAVAASSSDKAATTTTTSSNTKLAKADADFIKEAAMGGMMEVQLGKMAQDKAASDSVKQFGKKMEQDHTKANDELKKLAADKGVQIPTALDKKHQNKIDKLAKASGADFDRQYMSDMVSDHKTDVKEFQKQADKGKDSDLKNWAGQTLPTLKEHLQLAQSTEKQVKQAKSSSTNNKEQAKTTR